MASRQRLAAEFPRVTMDYQIARSHEIHDAHQRLFDIFARTYRCGKPTIVLLPGGIGSHLDRSVVPFKNDQSIPFALYDPVWMKLTPLAPTITGTSILPCRSHYYPGLARGSKQRVPPQDYKFYAQTTHQETQP
jgi:hypothetical protein